MQVTAVQVWLRHLVGLRTLSIKLSTEISPETLEESEDAGPIIIPDIGAHFSTFLRLAFALLPSLYAIHITDHKKTYESIRRSERNPRVVTT